MEDLKQIQEFFSKPVNENSRLRKQSILIEPAEIKYTESFGTGIKAPGVLHKANAGVFLGAEGAYIIVLPGGTFYVDEDTETAMPIWPLKDQSQALHRALDFTPFAPKYEEWKNWIKRPKTVDEATKDEETEFHSKLDKLVHDTFGKRKGEMEESNLNDPVAMKMRAAKDKLAKMRAANAGDDGNDKFFDAAKLRALEKKRAQIMRDMEQEAEMEGGEVADRYGDMLNKIDKAIAMLSEYNTGIYYTPDTKEKTKDAAKSGMEKVKDMLKKIMTEKKGHGEKVSKEFFSKLQGKTISYKGEDYIVVDSDEAVLRLQDEDGNYKTINFNQFNISGLIREVMETIELGKQLDEKKLCKKGQAYRKRRMAAGEKSSAYLSGRAVKVCKGQISGKKKKKKK